MMRLKITQCPVLVTPDGRLTRHDAANYLGVAAQTFANWNTQGRGPKPLRMGRKVFYRLDDLDAFLASTGLAA